MANEAIKVELTNSTGFPRAYKCVAATRIPKGSLMVLSSTTDHTAVICNGLAAQQVFLGVAAHDRETTDPATISVWTSGVFQFVASGSITRGSRVETAAGENLVQASTATDPAKIVGFALNSVSNGQRVEVALHCI